MKKIAFLLFFGLFLSNSCTVVDPELIALIQDIEKQNVALSDQIKSLQSKSDSLINELKKSDTKQTELIQRITNLQSELAKVLSQMNAINQQLQKQGADLTAINALLADLQKKYEGILGQLTQLQRLSQILLELEALKKQLADLDSKYQVITTTLGQNQQALNALKAQITALQSQMSQNLTKIDQLTTQLGEQGVDIDKLLAEIDALKKSTEALKAKIDEILRGKSPVPTAGLVAWYPFNGNANDESGKGNNGVVTGTVLTNDRFGNSNKAYSFNGSSGFIDLGRNENLATKQFTIATWIKIGAPLSSINMILRARYYGYGLHINSSGQVVGEIFDNANTGHSLSSTSKLNDGKWHLVVFSFENKTLRLYINGTVEVSKVTIGDSIYYGLSGVAIGRDADANLHYFNGVIDELTVWNRALTSQEITKIYNGEKF